QLDTQNNNQKEQVDDKDTMIYEGIDLLSLDSGKSADELVGFALNVSKVLFSRDELKEGIYALDDGKSRSKNRIPFDVHRTQIVKEALVKKFNYDPKSIESVWKSWRRVAAKCNASGKPTGKSIGEQYDFEITNDNHESDMEATSTFYLKERRRMLKTKASLADEPPRKILNIVANFNYPVDILANLPSFEADRLVISREKKTKA
ncbi:unnamed protein product, partial [Brachionus calyciflorus]